MPSRRASDGSHRRAAIALHFRLKIEVEARKAGHQPITWRNGKLIVRTPSRKMT
jgi:hypothetical protein